MHTLLSEQNSKRLFGGKKAQWLPLLRRLVARLMRLSSVELVAERSGALCIRDAKPRGKPVGRLQVTASGLELGLALSKARVRPGRLRPCARNPKWITHRVLITDIEAIDDELFTWIKAANPQGRTARRRSI